MKKLTTGEAKVIICEMIEAKYRIENYLKTKNKPMVSDEQLRTALDLAIKTGKD